MTLLVCGFGRCGSSLVMQMLNAAGMKCAGEYPAFEDNRTSISSFDAGFVSTFDGAVKVLDPHRVRFMPGDYKIVWLDRNVVEQAKSQIKLLKTIGMIWMSTSKQESQAINSMAISNRNDRDGAYKKMSLLGPIQSFGFESIIGRDPSAIKRLALFTGCDATVMAKEILDRTPECKPDMAIELSLLKKTPSPVR